LEKEIYSDLYDIMRGSRNIDGDFTFKGFHKNDNSTEYEDLFYSILEVIKEDIGDDYWKWYDKAVSRYVKWRRTTNKNDSVYIPQYRFANIDHTVRQQLSVLKFYCYRKASSGYQK
jgi:hypothetical protein